MVIFDSDAFYWFSSSIVVWMTIPDTEIPVARVSNSGRTMTPPTHCGTMIISSSPRSPTARACSLNGTLEMCLVR